MNSTPEDQMPSILSELLPNTMQWATALASFTERAPNVSLAITNSLGGAIYMIPQLKGDMPSVVSYDASGYSSALRMVWYTAKLIKATNVFQHLSEDHRVALFRYLSVFIQIASDNLSIPELGGLWMQDNSRMDTAIIDLLAETQALLVTWLPASRTLHSSFVESGLKELFDDSKGTTTASYYSGRAYAALITELNELCIQANTAKEEEFFRRIRSAPTFIANVAFVSSALESKGLLRLCNEQIANLTGLNLQERLDEGELLLIIGYSY